MNTGYGKHPDLLVVGAGMAGLAAAARAASHGLKVLVVEKRDEVGGSAALSAGIVWTAPNLAVFERVASAGDPQLGRALIDDFEPAVQRVRELGIPVSERWSGQMGFGLAYHVDIGALLARWVAELEGAGGELVLSTAARSLELDPQGAVRRVLVDGPDGRELIEAGAVLLASGGFQGDHELVAQLIGFGAQDLPLRSASGSVGDGLRMGRSAGAALSRGLGMFYGHLIPDRVSSWQACQYLPLTQYHSAFSIVVNSRGRRFCDESLGDEVINQATLRQPGARAVLICDERIRREHAMGPPYPHGQPIDRFAVAREVGARLVRADTLEGLTRAVGALGVDGAGLRRTLADYASAADGEAVALDAPLPASPAKLNDPPFHALAVTPTVTFPFGGLSVDADGHVLDRDDRWVPNLFAAGADAGGLQGPGYVGGLVLGLVFGPRAADAAWRALRPDAAQMPFAGRLGCRHG